LQRDEPTALSRNTHGRGTSKNSKIPILDLNLKRPNYFNFRVLKWRSNFLPMKRPKSGLGIKPSLSRNVVFTGSIVHAQNPLDTPDKEV
jgi:hypothetical protein